MDETPISTKDTPGPFDGFETAKPGEPIFTLQGGDPLGGPLVLLWASLARRRALGSSPDPMLYTKLCQAMLPVEEAKVAALLIKAREAENIGWAMGEYLRGEVEKPREDRASYSGEELTEEAMAAVDRARALKAAESKLHNALAEANEQAEALDALGGVEPMAIDMIRAAVEVLKKAAEIVGPKRPAYMTPEQGFSAATEISEGPRDG